MHFSFLIFLLIVGLFQSVPADNNSDSSSQAVHDFRQNIFENRGGRQWTFEKIDNAQDRCCNTGCIAKVSTGPGQLVSKVINHSKKASIFFEEGSDSLNQEAKSIIETFVSENRRNYEIVITSYTDGCGSGSYNQDLSDRRAKAVKAEYVRMHRYASIKIVSAGEISSGHDPSSRRVDITLKENTVLYEPPPKIVADVYLIDGSGSMSGSDWQEWYRAIAFHRPPGSRVYVSTTGCIRNGKRLNAIRPNGATEIWLSYWTVLDNMRPGETLAIISDFDSTIPLSQREHSMITEKVREKKVVVNAIVISN